MTENELKEKLVDAIYTIVKRVPDFCPDYNQIAKDGADTIMDIIKEYDNSSNNDITQEEKELLLKDLCARLPYGVYFMVPEINEPVKLLSINPKRDKPLEIDDGHAENSSTYWKLEDAKPYLRPMSSMTEEEKKDYNSKFEGRDFSWEIYYGSTDWLNEHHFDYRSLIEKGLALEAPEDMYNDRNV